VEKALVFAGQQELALKSNISQANISAMEKGSRPIGLNVAIKLAKILRCDYKKLL
jgi:transcriptional regulator with XRE-family HTH domain